MKSRSLILTLIISLFLAASVSASILSPIAKLIKEAAPAGMEISESMILKNLENGVKFGGKTGDQLMTMSRKEISTFLAESRRSEFDAISKACETCSLKSKQSIADVKAYITKLNLGSDLKGIKSYMKRSVKNFDKFSADDKTVLELFFVKMEKGTKAEIKFAKYYLTKSDGVFDGNDTFQAWRAINQLNDSQLDELTKVMKQMDGMTDDEFFKAVSKNGEVAPETITALRKCF